MTCGANDGETASGLNFRCKLDIGTTTCHVGGDGDGTKHPLLVVDIVLSSLSLEVSVSTLGTLVGSIDKLLLIAQRGRLVGEGTAVAGHPHHTLGALTGLSNDHSLLLMEFGVEDLMRNLAHGQHLGEQLTDLDRCSTHQARTSLDTHVLDLFNDSTIFLAIGLIDAVIHIVADNRLVGRNLDHIELVDIPELTGLSAGGTSHTGKLMIHTEVVLQRDGGKGLCGSLHLDMLLGFDSLMESVAPAASLHDTSGLLVDNLHLTVHDDIFVILVEHGVCFQQLLQRMYSIALNSIVVEQVVLLVETILVTQGLVALKGRKLSSNIGEHKEVLIIDLLGEPVRTLVGEVCTVEFLVDNEIERLDSLGHQSVVVLHIDLLGLLQTSLDAFLREIFDKCLVLRQCLVRAEEAEESVLNLLLIVFLTTLSDLLSCLSQELSGLLTLHLVEALHQRLILLIHLVVALGDRTRDDQRGTGIIDKHGVDLIDDGIVVAALHQVAW